MEKQPFFIEYFNNDELDLAEVKPCCQENDIFYYDIYIKNEYQFTLTPSANEDNEIVWKISLKNADKNIEKELITSIGKEIENTLYK
jgi:hypothetical protein